MSISEAAARRIADDLTAAGALSAADMRRVNDNRVVAIIAARASGRRWDNLPTPVAIPQSLLDAEAKEAKAAKESGTTLEGAAAAQEPSSAIKLKLIPNGVMYEDDCRSTRPGSPALPEPAGNHNQSEAGLL